MPPPPSPPKSIVQLFSMPSSSACFFRLFLREYRQPRRMRAKPIGYTFRHLLEEWSSIVGPDIGLAQAIGFPTRLSALCVSYSSYSCSEEEEDCLLLSHFSPWWCSSDFSLLSA